MANPETPTAPTGECRGRTSVTTNKEGRVTASFILPPLEQAFDSSGVVSMGESATAYAGAGWPVLPLQPTGTRAKQPCTLHGHKDATTTASQIKTWWKIWPDALIGYAPPPGIIVLDIDRPTALADLEAINEGPLPDTLTARTGRFGGGWHYYYTTTRTDLTQGVVRHLDGQRVHGVDVRLGGRGYLIVPPSLHPITRTPYRWESLRAPAPLTDLLEAACGPVAPRPMPLRTNPYSAHIGTVDGLVRTVKEAPEGTRNRTLYWAACRMWDHSREGRPIDWDALKQAASAAGLSAGEISRTIGSAATAATTRTSEPEAGAAA